MNNTDKLWNFLGLFTVALGVLFIFSALSFAIFSPKRTLRYELYRNPHISESGIPCLTKIIENDVDIEIPLSKDVTWQQAIQICDSLNKQLKKYPIK